MLEAAHRAKAGLDVVAGYIEPHTRPETLALLDGLEQLPTKGVPYKGIELHEFDLDGALARKPQLILVDELAHTNAPGCRHAKRYQDVQELLRAGISVYTTVNVQHLESLNDVVASITGITVAERIPDSVFDSADQVEVTDLEPADLLERLRAGKIYRGPQAAQAIGHFFTDKNLAALREIALRRTADRLERNTEDEDGSRPKIGEHILICLSGAPSNAKVIRTAARMAEAFHGAFTALFVETPQFATQSEADRRACGPICIWPNSSARVSLPFMEMTPPFRLQSTPMSAGFPKLSWAAAQASRPVPFPQKPDRSPQRSGTRSGYLHYSGPVRSGFPAPKAAARRTGAIFPGRTA